MPARWTHGWSSSSTTTTCRSLRRRARCGAISPSWFPAPSTAASATRPSRSPRGSRGRSGGCRRCCRRRGGAVCQRCTQAPASDGAPFLCRCATGRVAVHRRFQRPAAGRGRSLPDQHPPRHALVGRRCLSAAGAAAWPGHAADRRPGATGAVRGAPRGGCGLPAGRGGTHGSRPACRGAERGCHPEPAVVAAVRRGPGRSAAAARHSGGVA